MFNFTIIINYNLPNEKSIELSDELKDDTSQTTIYQVKEFLQEFLNVQYDTIKIEIIRNLRKVFNINDDTFLKNDDTLRVSFSIPYNYNPILLRSSNNTQNERIKNSFIRYRNGAFYNGETKNNKKDGYGKTIFHDGYSHEGEYKNDKADGYGKYISPDGSSYEGEWKNNEKKWIWKIYFF